MSDTPKVPGLSRSVVDALDGLFPEHSPEADWSHAHCMYRAGQRAVVRFLIQELRAQNENITELPTDVRRST